MTPQVKSFDEYQQQWKNAQEDPNHFWEEVANTYEWRQKWTKLTSGSFENADVKWFEDGQLNITENCLDRHLATRGEKTAIIYEANQPDSLKQTMTYKELHTQVCKFANVLTDMGIKKGDRVVTYMSMIPELAIAVLACARIGAVHSVVFAGFSAKALAGRIQDCAAKLVLTNDSAFRGTKEVPLKEICDEALKECPTVEKSIVVRRTYKKTDWQVGRDLWWHDLMKNASSKHQAVAVGAEDPLFILYTSGSTGRPKGLLHTAGGYMVYAGYSFKNVFQIEEDDVYWCTADIGWITGHSYIVYGPLLNGSTTMMFEGVPTYPDAGRFWDIVEKHQVTHFYTAPTAIRALEAYDVNLVRARDLSSLKVLGTVGEPINKEAWDWYNEEVGKKNCPIVDTWWQTETGGIMISPLAGITKLKPSFATLPLPGIEPCLMDEKGNEIAGNGVEGNLCIKRPWPSIARTVYGDHERYKDTYFSTYKGHYFTGDGCKRDEEGFYRITGRVDDVMNVSGHRIGTAEVENAINEHLAVVESAVVGYPHDVKGQGIFAYVICNTDLSTDFAAEVRAKVTEVIGPIAKPDKVLVVPGLPKTRSGKIMRRILRKIAAGDTANLGDVSTLLDPSVVESIKAGAAKL